MFKRFLDWLNEPKIYCIYNCTGMAYNNTQFYIKALNNLTSQKLRGVKVIVSSCLNKNHEINLLLKKCPNISICRVQERVPISISFNLTVQKTVEKFGLPSHGFLYIDSGIDFKKDKLVLKKLYKLIKNKEYALIHPQSDENKQYISDKNYIIPIGSSSPLVCGLFATEWYNIYGKILPDIFKGMYIEETFSFMAAAMKSKILISKDIKIEHKAEMDGTALIAECTPWQRCGGKLWQHPYLISEIDFMNRLTGKDAKELGLGYAESLKICMHDKSIYKNNNNLFPLSTQDYIKKNYFLSSKELDYNKLQYEWIDN